MEELLSWINYCRHQPKGYYVCGQDYGYGDDYQEAQSVNGDKILELWKIKSKWRDMATDFRQYLIDRNAEHNEDDKPIEGSAGVVLQQMDEGSLEYSIEINIQINPEYVEYFQKKGYNFDPDDRYTIIFEISNTGDGIENNIINIATIEKEILSVPAEYLRYAKIEENEFYYSSFNTAEELNTKIKDAVADDWT